jgi:Ca-activated chloride channel family protein
VTFARPDYLPLAPLAALLFTLALGWHWHRLRRLVTAYDAPVLRRLLPAGSGRFPTARLLGLVASGVAIGLAAAGLQWGEPDEAEPPSPLDIAIVVDLSLSMSATDVAPNRVVRAREVIARLTEELPSVRFSLVSFAGWPLTLLPPTDDPTVVRYFAQSLGVELVQPTDRGSSLADALWLARSTLEARPRTEARQVVLLLTDGDVGDGDQALAEAAAQASDGIEIWAAGVGTETGVSLFVDGAPLLDQGVPVIARLDETLLRALADAGQGRYENVSGEGGLESLVASLSELSGDDRDSDVPPVDAAFLLVLLAVPTLLWEGASDAGRTVRARGRTEK